MAFIVVDFDGTCVTHTFPGIGDDIGAVPVLKELVKNGHDLILFTMRSNKPELDQFYLLDAIEWFKKMIFHYLESKQIQRKKHGQHHQKLMVN